MHTFGGILATESEDANNVKDNVSRVVGHSGRANWL